jgi:hypothetical protein
MEDQKQHLDEIFRRKLHDAEVPPPPFVWPAVEQALQQQNRRRPIAFWWFAAAGTLLLGAVALWMLNRPDSGAISAINPPAMEEKAKEQPQKNPDALPAPIQLLTEPGDAINVKETGKTAQKHLQARKAGVAPEQAQVFQVINEAAQDPNISAQGASVEDLAVSNVSDVSDIRKLLDFSNLPMLKAETPVTARPSVGLPAMKPFKSGARRKKIQPKVCYDFNRHPSALLVDVYAGPSIAQRSLTSRLDDEPYLKQRLATERRDLAFNAGIRASLMFQRNYLLRTGLHYEQITEVFEYIDPTSVTYTLKFTPGNPIPDTIGVQYGENYLKTYNRYGMLDIPLMLGVEMRSGRTGFNVNAGISANVLFWKRGAIIDPQTHEPERFGQKETLSEEVFRTRLSLSAGATVQWYWHASNRIRLFIEPSFRQVLKPVTLSNHPVDQRYSILGLRMGSTMIF